jgi:hypothetical protein
VLILGLVVACSGAGGSGRWDIGADGADVDDAGGVDVAVVAVTVAGVETRGWSVRDVLSVIEVKAVRKELGREGVPR